MTGCRTKSARCLGLLLTILVLWATQGVCAKKKPPLHPVNVNTATAAELRQVPGIGPATADKILQARKSCGHFKSVDELQSIRGIGAKRLEKMRRYLTVGAPVQGKPALASSHAAANTKAALPKTTAKPTAAPKTPPPEADDEEP